METKGRAVLGDALAAELRAEIARQRLTDDEVSRRTNRGVSKATVYRVLRNERSPRADHLELICRALGVPMSVMIRRAKHAWTAPTPTPTPAVASATTSADTACSRL